jgi:hypothetical protein
MAKSTVFISVKQRAGFIYLFTHGRQGELWGGGREGGMLIRDLVTQDLCPDMTDIVSIAKHTEGRI